MAQQLQSSWTEAATRATQEYLALTVAFGLLQHGIAFGQSASAAVNGTVKDDTSAVISRWRTA